MNPGQKKRTKYLSIFININRFALSYSVSHGPKKSTVRNCGAMRVIRYGFECQHPDPSLIEAR
jgi:hypothetical protein